VEGSAVLPLQPIFRNSSYYLLPCPKENRKPTRKVNGSEGYPMGPIRLLLVRLSSCV